MDYKFSLFCCQLMFINIQKQILKLKNLSQFPSLRIQGQFGSPKLRELPEGVAKTKFLTGCFLEISIVVKTTLFPFFEKISDRF